MGQQQLLLIILGVIIVGIAVAVGITMFQDNAVSANRDAVTNDLVQLAAKSQQYFRKPVSLGGGGNSFASLTADAAGMAKLVSVAFSDNDNGTYTISTAGTASTVIFTGVGKTAQASGAMPTYTCTVTAAGYTIARTDP
jgi:Tfp pilus assembly protein PilE